MDALVEFCRSGQLGPLHIGATAIDVQRHLGPADDVAWVHGESNWQRHRYGNLSLILMSRPGQELDPSKLRLETIELLMRSPLAVPEPVSPGLPRGGQYPRLQEL